MDGLYKLKKEMYVNQKRFKWEGSDIQNYLKIIKALYTIRFNLSTKLILFVFKDISILNRYILGLVFGKHMILVS